MPEEERPRVTVVKGIIIKTGDYESARVSYGIESTVPLGMTMEDAIKDLERLIDKLLEEEKKKMLGYQVEVVKPPQVVETKPKPSINTKTIIEMFPQEIRANVSIEITDNEYRVKLPFGAITGEKFAEVTRAIEKIGGQWVRAGKESHWKIPIHPKEGP
jgi:hypothetical protein